jgi:hypothetical protein
MKFKKLACLCAILIFSISFFAQAASAQPSKNNVEDFVASEMEYIIQAQQSINKPSNNEMRDLETDRLTGKPWHEVEQEILLPKKQKSAHRKISEADFLAAEFDYIEQAKKAIMNTQEVISDEESIDPLSGKRWEEIESQF